MRTSLSAMCILLSAVFVMLGSATLKAQAGEKTGQQAYQVMIDLRKAGKKISSSSLIVSGGQKGTIKNLLDDSTGTHFEVVVHEQASKLLVVEYRFTEKTKKGTLEIAKTGVGIALGGTETSQLKDSGGNDLELLLTVKEPSKNL